MLYMASGYIQQISLYLKTLMNVVMHQLVHSFLHIGILPRD